ncbi:MAG: efflux RND transporter periplasmic adaptor subunit [Myxococcota bacterium]
MKGGWMVRIGLPIAAAALFGFAVVTTLSQPSRSDAEPALPVASTPFEGTVAGVGVVEPRGEAIAIGTNLPGIATTVHVRAGDRVGPGDPLFTIDDRAARAELALARAQVASAEVALADARDQFERAQKSFEQRATSDAEATRRRFAVESARARLAEARARVAAIQTEIDRLTVRSPSAGRIWRVDLRAGEFAPTGPLASPLVVLGDDSQLHVRVEVDQTDAHRVRAGAPAAGSLRGDAARRLPLEFVRFEPLVQPKRALTGDGAERVDTRVLEVLYALPAQTPNVFVGQQMDVFIEAEPLGLEGGEGLAAQR